MVLRHAAKRSKKSLGKEMIEGLMTTLGVEKTTDTKSFVGESRNSRKERRKLERMSKKPKRPVETAKAVKEPPKKKRRVEAPPRPVESESESESEEEAPVEEPAKPAVWRPGFRRTEEVSEARRRVKRALNKLSEGTVVALAGEVEQVYKECPKSEVDSSLTQEILEAVIIDVPVAPTLLNAYGALVALLHVLVGPHVGLHLLERLCVRLKESVESGAISRATNTASLLAILYSLKIAHCSLVYSVVRAMVETVDKHAASVDVLLYLLRTAGSQLRYDDPSSLKDIIEFVGERTGAMEDLPTRVRVMLDLLSDIKNNKLLKKKENNVDEERRQQLQRVVSDAAVRAGREVEEAMIKVPYQDFLDAETRGRWWVTGASWLGRESTAGSSFKPKSSVTMDKKTLELQDLAKSQRMVTDLRKDAFVAVMGSEDYIDAFQRLVKLGLEGKRGREIVHVVLDCCAQEKSYNPFYAMVLAKVAGHTRNLRRTVIMAFWDHFKSLETYPARKLVNLGRLVAFLISHGTLTLLATLRHVDLASLESKALLFFRLMFAAVLIDTEERRLQEMFANLFVDPEAGQLKDGVRSFVYQFSKPSFRASFLPEIMELHTPGLDSKTAKEHEKKIAKVAKLVVNIKSLDFV